MPNASYNITIDIKVIVRLYIIYTLEAKIVAYIRYLSYLVYRDRLAREVLVYIEYKSTILNKRVDILNVEY